MELLVEAECTEIGAEIYCTFIDRFENGSGGKELLPGT